MQNNHIIGFKHKTYLHAYEMHELLFLHFSFFKKVNTCMFAQITILIYKANTSLSIEYQQSFSMHKVSHDQTLSSFKWV